MNYTFKYLEVGAVELDFLIFLNDLLYIFRSCDWNFCIFEDYSEASKNIRG